MLLGQKHKKTWNPAILFSLSEAPSIMSHQLVLLPELGCLFFFFFFLSPKWWCFFNPYKHIICWLNHPHTWSWTQCFYIGLADVLGKAVLTSRVLFAFYPTLNYLWFVLMTWCGSCGSGWTCTSYCWDAESDHAGSARLTSDCRGSWISFPFSTTL